LAAAGWRERVDAWARTSRAVDWLYLSGLALVVVVAGCILAFG
jgi:hypothetical protein